jgi:hypothetical protein
MVDARGIGEDIVMQIRGSARYNIHWHYKSIQLDLVEPNGMEYNGIIMWKDR